MFTLHETTRRSLCRMGFVLLCVLPMCAILAATAWFGSDAYRTRQSSELSRILGLDVSLDRVVLTQPEGLRYEGLKLADPETGAILARAASFSVLRHGNKISTVAIAPELEVARLDGLEDLIMRQLRLGKRGQQICFEAEKLSLRMPDKSQRILESVHGRFDFAKDAAQALVEFRPMSRESEEPVAIRIWRNRQTTPPSMVLEAHTGKSTLPCSLMAPFAPSIARLGRRCEFQGAFAIDLPQASNGTLVGEFHNVDLAALVGDQYPRQLVGNATIAIGEAKLLAGRLEAVRGQLFCGEGTIHRQLAETCAGEFMLAGPKMKNTFGASHKFSELAFGFALDARGLSISGACRSAPPGAVLVDGSGVAVGEPVTRLPLATVEQVFSSSRHTLLGVLPIMDEGRKRR